jgi:hypothetical protein
MNRLTPELKKLFCWARQATQDPPPAIPLGFPARVATLWICGPSTNMFAVWQKAIWGSAGISAAIILLGLILLTNQRLRSGSFYDFSPAYQVVATKFVP